MPEKTKPRYCSTCKTTENILPGPVTVHVMQSGKVHKYTNCYKCHYARIAKYRKTVVGRQKVIELRKIMDKKYPEKYRARYLVNNAIKKGLINKPTSCSTCEVEASRIEGHHFDYSKPLEVMWFCTPCHRSIHRELNQKAIIEISDKT